MNLQETSGHILQIGDKVRMNIQELAKGELDGVEITSNDVNYWRYMNQHPDEIYEITGIDLQHEETMYVLSGAMADNTWYSSDLILIPEPKTNFEVIKSLTLDEMAENLSDMLTEQFPGVKAIDKESMKNWLLAKPRQNKNKG